MAPVAGFTFSPMSGIAPAAVQFADTSNVPDTSTLIGIAFSTYITSRFWEFGDGQTSVEENPLHTFRWAQTFPVRLTVTDSTGATDSFEATINISSQPPAPQIIAPKADFQANLQTGIAPFTVQFQNSSAGVITGYAWSFGDGKTSDDRDPAHTFTEPGVFEVSLTVFNEYGSTTRLYRIDVTAPDNTADANVGETVIDLVADIRAALRRPPDQKLNYSDMVTVLGDILRGYARDLGVSNQAHNADERQAVLNHLDGNVWLLNVPGVSEVELADLSFRSNAAAQNFEIWQKVTIVPLDYFGERAFLDAAVGAVFGGTLQETGVKIKLNLAVETVRNAAWKALVRIPTLKLLQLSAKIPLPADFVPMIKNEAKLLLLPYIRDNSPEFYTWRKFNEPVWLGQKMEWMKRWEMYLNANPEPNTAPKIAANAYRFGGRRARYTVEPRQS